ncbi:hypothetical protein L7F22_048459 [Adiantum nelumboides]|nr:hypothetical protein [Adiantum nelumboides]
MFIASADPEGTVVKQWSSDDPCRGVPWKGVNCSGFASTFNVTSLVMENMNLSGFIPEGTLGKLTELRILSLKGNGLTGQIPTDLINCAQLKHLYLSDNSLSGIIPSPLSHRLKRIYLSDNKLSGFIPSSFADMDSLLSLFLQNNMLDGNIPNLSQQSLVELNVSDNNLSGQIPSAISSKGFAPSVFMNNLGLCGVPMQACLASLGVGNSTVGSDDQKKNQTKSKNKLAAGLIATIVVATIAIMCFMAICVVCRYKRRYLKKRPSMKVVPNDREDFLSLSSVGSLTTDDDKPRLVFFEESHTFRLEDLLRASAELLGRGSLGCAYKVIMDDGRAMCVKRLKDLNHVARKEFEQQMQFVGKLRHPNVVPLWAYYHAKEEKLLVYDYQPNGNLLNLLRAGQQWRAGNGFVAKPLSWNARLRIAKGIANGLAFLHHECESLNIPHGTIKSSNILIDKDYEARIADFGLAMLLMGPSLVSKPANVMAYQAPECNNSKQRITQMADVYSFGVLLLELLTGRLTQVKNDDDDDISHVSPGSRASFNLPEWVTTVVKEEWSAEVFDRTLFSSNSSEESLITMLQIAMGCTSKSPEQRPRMAQVCKMIADVHEDDKSAFSTSMSFDHSRLHVISSDDSTIMSSKTPPYDDRDISFEF